jgi:TonB family protein|tara:strand:+ start:1119 stop:1928 length:810 start_codon:yes stop_codon:yes gene_type:complete
MTPNMMKDPLSHIYFIVALLTSLIIHLSLVMYGGFQYTDIANFEISSDIELTIIQEPKMNTSSQKLPQDPIQETPIKEPIKITNKSITPKVVMEKKALSPKIERTLVLNEELNPKNKVELIDEKIQQSKAINTDQLISDLSKLDLTPRNKNRPRVKTVSARTTDYEYRLYFEAWRQKVERLGSLNYPEEARAGNLGTLRLTVSLASEGQIKQIIVNKSSGFDALDKAAIKIVELGEPYAAFSDKMRKEVDIINITRAWKFTEENNFSSN